MKNLLDSRLYLIHFRRVFIYVKSPSQLLNFPCKRNIY